MLDISIINADKISDKPQKLKEFFKHKYIITEKFDGTKLTLWRNNEPWNTDYTKNWVISFKQQILYAEEFKGLDLDYIKDYSVGISQYALIHEHMKKIHDNTKEIPLNTEFFIEFIQNKLTTTRQYTHKHDLFLIAHSNSNAEIVGGLIKTSPQWFSTEKADDFALILNMLRPPILFNGYINSIEHIETGIIDTRLLSAWQEFRLSYNKNRFFVFKKFLLSIPSILGGKTEGVVMQSEHNIYKFVQLDQYCRDTRFKRKQEYQASEEIEQKYWSKINNISGDFLKTLNVLDSLPTLLNHINTFVYNMDSNHIIKKFQEKFSNKKLLTNDDLIMKIKDDLFLTTKQKVLDILPENQNALFIGKMRIPTKAHVNMIEEALKKCPHVVICIVKAKKEVKESLTFELQTEILESIFGNKVTVITHSTGNVTSIINKSPKRLRYLLSGSDRFESYMTQLKRHPSIILIETQRSGNSISATRAIESIKTGNLIDFKSLVTDKVYIDFLPKIKEQIEHT